MSVTIAEAVSSLIRNRFIASGPNNRWVTVFLDGLTSDCSVVGVAVGVEVEAGVASWSSGVMLVVVVVVVVGVESPIVGFCG